MKEHKTQFGYAIIDENRIENIYIFEAHRGNGHAYDLMEWALDALSNEPVIELDARPEEGTDLGKLVAFYEAYGFEVVDREENAAWMELRRK